MTTATADRPRARCLPAQAGPAPRRIEPRQLRWLMMLWREVSPNLAIERLGDRAIEELENPERAVRLAYASQKLGFEVRSFTQLTRAQAGELLAAMRKDLGLDLSLGTRRWSLRYIYELAPRLWETDWDRMLAARLERRPYFHFGAVDSLAPRQIHALIEELFDHLERKLYPDQATTNVRHARKEALRREVRAKFRHRTIERSGHRVIG